MTVPLLVFAESAAAARAWRTRCRSLGVPVAGAMVVTYGRPALRGDSWAIVHDLVQTVRETLRGVTPRFVVTIGPLMTAAIAKMDPDLAYGEAWQVDGHTVVPFPDWWDYDIWVSSAELVSAMEA